VDSYDGDGMFSFSTARWRYDDKASAYGCDKSLEHMANEGVPGSQVVIFTWWITWVILATGVVMQTVHYAITSLDPLSARG
jgi:hypothetical protein